MEDQPAMGNSFPTDDQVGSVSMPKSTSRTSIPANEEPGATERLRFLLLSQPRNGTHFVRGLLNTHPEISCADEPMNPSVNRRDIPAKTIAESIWQEPGKRANGFIIHWNQHTDEGGLGEGFLDDLPEDVRVVWVYRLDALAAIVSRRICEITGRWHSSEPTTTTLKLKAAEVRVAYEEIVRERRQMSAWMRRRRAGLTVFYEDVVADPDMQSVQAFLGVTLAPLSVTNCEATRQEWRKLSAVVQNYHGLRHELARTPLAALFLTQHE
jgi:hypothetical protein